jgi:S1-C subfamily serine protease
VKSGVLITEVYVDSPAAKGQLKPGDIIVEFNGVGVNKASELAWLTTTAGVGTKVKIKILRAGRFAELMLRVTHRPRELHQ